MGIFNKKKILGGSASALSESEIQKKLYGEFNVGMPYLESSGRRDLDETDASSGGGFFQASSQEKAPAVDLFTLPKESFVEPDLPPKALPPETRSSELPPRYVPIRDFEKAAPSSTTSGADPYSRFRYNRPDDGKMAAMGGFVKDAFSKTTDLLRDFSHPKYVTVRRVFYWGSALLAVFLLFWGVNHLNSQREKAMSVRYQAPVQQATVVTPAESFVPVVAPVAEAPRASKPQKSNPVSESSASKNVSPGYYVIQVVTYPTKPDADRVVNAFRQEGLRAFVKENARPSGRVFYLVLLGGFKSEAEAQSQLLKFRAKDVARPFQDAFVKSSRA